MDKMSQYISTYQTASGKRVVITPASTRRYLTLAAKLGYDNENVVLMACVQGRACHIWVGM